MSRRARGVQEMRAVEPIGGDAWDRDGGPVSEADQAAAWAAFDELEGLPADRRSV